MVIHTQGSDNLPGIYLRGERDRFLSRNYNRSPFAHRWRAVLISLTLLTILLPFAGYADPGMVNTEGVSSGSEVIIWGPYLTNTTHNSTVIHWKTLTPSVGRVGFACSGVNSSPGIPNQSISEKNPSQFHELQLNNLEPGQRYSYWIGNNPGNYSFRTLPADGPFVFIVYGDTREQLPRWNQSTHHALVAERIAKESDCLFVVHTGDLR